LLQLLETADESAKDVGGLDAKLNRKRHLEAKNLTVEESLIRRSIDNGDNVGAMKRNLSVFSDHSRVNNDQIRANLSKVFTLICANLSEVFTLISADLVEGIPFN